MQSTSGELYILIKILVKGCLTLYAEMKLPGEAWLEFKIVNNRLVQTATFRPLGVYGRIYWHADVVFPSTFSLLYF